MDEIQKEAIKKAYEGAISVKDEFFSFRNQTKNQLLANQFQLFQSLATIVLAFIAIVVATKLFYLGFWFIVAAIFSILLIIYTLAFIREAIDRTDKDMNDTEKLLTAHIEEVENKINETFQKNNYKIFEDFVRQEPKDQVIEERKLFYAGEFAMFLFLNSLFFSVAGIISSYMLLDKSYSLFIFCASILLSVVDWNLIFTKKLSGLLNKKICKN